jgi:hypothetical protein
LLQDTPAFSAFFNMVLELSRADGVQLTVEISVNGGA